MAKRTSLSRVSSSSRSSAPGFSWKNFFLLVSLLPIAAGVLLIIAWALDLLVWDAPIQISIAIFSLLLGFTISNAAQQNWVLTAGWLLLAVGDLLFLSPRIEILYGAIALVAAGILLVVFELARRFLKQKKQN
jgi:hypothetical protein